MSISTLAHQNVSATIINSDEKNITIKRVKELIPYYPLFEVNGALIINESSTGSLTFDGENNNFRRGSMFIVNGDFTLKSGTIKNSKATNGGAIAANINSNINICGGKISNNNATANGGAIYTVGNVIISGGVIDGNSSENGAGAVFYSGNESTTFNMTEGTISNNITSGLYGGGIYFDKGHAEITGGVFSGNSADFIGGGIYVNDGATVKMLRVLIYNNHADIQGGGIYNCPTGGGNYQMFNGMTLYNNTAYNNPAGSEGDDFYSANKEGIYRERKVYVSEYALDGSKVGYYKDESVNRYKPGDTVSNPDYYQNKSVEIALKSAASESVFNSSKDLAKIKFYGNSAKTGGGIGNNGILTIGSGTALKIEKKLFDGITDANTDFNFNISLTSESGEGYTGEVVGEYNNLKKSIHFENGKATLQLKGNEFFVFYDIPVGLNYNITEEIIPGYTTVSKLNTSGKIKYENLGIASFVNNVTGNLKVIKKVYGTSEDENKNFDFTVVLNDTNINGTYGDMIFENGLASFTLKHEENKLATGLPAGVIYIVSENSNENYTIVQDGGNGTIERDKTLIATFENHKNIPSDETNSKDDSSSQKHSTNKVKTGDNNFMLGVVLVAFLCSIIIILVSSDGKKNHKPKHYF